MATKTKRLHIALEFGSVSFAGDGSARLGIKIDRTVMTILQADSYLCGKRLAGKITVTSGDDPDQKTLVDDLHEEIEATFDAKRFSISPSHITSSLAFVLEDEQAATLARFAKKQGRLLIDNVEVLEVGKEETEGDSD